MAESHAQQKVHHETAASSQDLQHASAEKTPASFCGGCGASAPAGTDLCEHCGSWLLVGQCVFCYEPIAAREPFCGECGNPPKGIQCECGTRSIFHFCPDCQAELTEQAAQEVKELRESEPIRALSKSLTRDLKADPGADTDVNTAGDAPDVPVDPALPERDLSIEKDERSASLPNPAVGSEEPSAGFDFDDQAEADLFERMAQGKVEREKAKRTEEKRRASAPSELKEVQAALEAAQQKKFKTNQDARKHFSALQVVLPGGRMVPTIWVCNAYGTHHHVPPGPDGCGRPQDGGRFTNYEERKGHVEFDL